MTDSTVLTPEQIADGWKVHDGGDCPIEPDAQVTIKIRSGVMTRWLRADSVIWRYGSTIWEADAMPMPPECEVIAYREEPKQ